MTRQTERAKFDSVDQTNRNNKFDSKRFACINTWLTRYLQKMNRGLYRELSFWCHFLLRLSHFSSRFEVFTCYFHLPLFFFHSFLSNISFHLFIYFTFLILLFLQNVMYRELLFVTDWQNSFNESNLALDCCACTDFDGCYIGGLKSMAVWFISQSEAEFNRDTCSPSQRFILLPKIRLHIRRTHSRTCENFCFAISLYETYLN